MNTELFVAALAVIAIILVLASWATSFSARLRPPASAPSSPNARQEPGSESAERTVLSPQSCQHVWLITAHEETAGHPRVIYRCSTCGRLESREVI